MNSKKVVNSFLIMIFIFFACTTQKKHPFDESYYEKSENEWLTTMAMLGYQGTKLSNHILLVMHTTECTPCLKELAWWNTQGKDRTSAVVNLIVIERYQSTLTTFLDVQHIQLPVFRDSAAVLLNKKLIPTTPVKLYFNKEGRVTVIREMGANGDISQFLNQVNQQENEIKQ